MTEKDNISYTIGELTDRTIDQKLVPNINGVSSQREFVRRAISNNTPDIKSLVAGTGQLRTLIRLLDSIRVIEESLPEIEAKASMKGEKVSSEPKSIALDRGTQRLLKRIKQNSGLNWPTQIRYCLFWEMSLVTNQLEEDDWRRGAIVGTRANLQDSLITPRTRFIEILDRRFRLGGQSTQMLLEQDLNQFEDFANEYHNFYGSDLYEEFRESHPYGPFNDVENMIEELTEYTFSRSEESGFLEEFDSDPQNH